MTNTISTPTLNSVRALDPSGAGLFFQFGAAASAEAPGHGWIDGQAQAHIQANEDRWLEQLAQWHEHTAATAAQLSQDWWFTQASRIMSWYPTVTDRLFFAIAVIDRVERLKVDRAALVGCPHEVLSFIRELRPDWRIDGPAVEEAAAAHAPSRWRRAIGLVTEATRRLLAVSRNSVRALPLPENGWMLVYSHAMNPKTFAAAGDHFFGRGLNSLKVPGTNRRLKKVWLFLFAAGKTALKSEFAATVEKDGDGCLFVDDLIGWRELFSAVRSAFRIRRFTRAARPLLPRLTIDAHTSALFVSRWVDPQFNRSWPLHELFVFHALKRIIRVASKSERLPAALLYPYEQKALENALLLALRSDDRRVRAIQTIGFAHAVHNKGHLYMHAPRRSLLGQPLPQKLATTGPITKQWLHEWGQQPLKHLFVAGSPRYSEPLPPPKLDTPIKRALVIISSAHELPVFARMIRAAPAGAFAGWELVVRRYPYGWHKEQDLGVEILRSCGVRMTVEGGPLRAQLETIHAALFCSSSAGFEAMLAGRLGVCVNMNETMTLDLITGKGDPSALFHAQTIEPLLQSLTTIEQMDAAAYATRLAQQRQYAMSIYAPANFQSVLEAPLELAAKAPAAESSVRSVKQPLTKTADQTV